jgi:hypothetical protein
LVLKNRAGQNTEKAKNLEAPFTELFSILKRCAISTQGYPTLAYEVDELKMMSHHIDNAMTVLLQGLQDLGQVTSMISQGGKRIIEDLDHIGFLISAISNLTEALNNLRLDTSYSLIKHKELKIK